jgi:nucleoside-diphosphate-sugar epimerase
MTVTVIGGAGYVGSVITQRLLSSERVHCIDPCARGHAGVHALLPVDGFEWHLPPPVGTLEAPIRESRAVIYAAGVVGETACKRDEEGAHFVNADLPGRYAELCKTLGIPFLYISTCSVYAETPITPRSESRSRVVLGGSGLMVPALDELDPPRATGLYARTKLLGETNTRNLGGNVVRFGTICGAAPIMRWDLLVNEIAWLAANFQTAERFKLWSPNRRRPFLANISAAKYVVEWVNSVARRASLVNAPGQHWEIGALLRRLLGEQYSTVVEETARDPDAFASRSYAVTTRHVYNPTQKGGQLGPGAVYDDLFESLLQSRLMRDI